MGNSLCFFVFSLSFFKLCQKEKAEKALIYCKILVYHRKDNYSKL